jgi:hypothetical protein
MQPLIPDGSRVIAFLHDPAARLRVGDVVLARRPDRPEEETLKRIAAMDGDRLELRGDNAADSWDSRKFGPVDRTDVIAVVRWRYWPIPPRPL